jgi:hypothetical protein
MLKMIEVKICDVWGNAQWWKYSPKQKVEDRKDNQVCARILNMFGNKVTPQKKYIWLHKPTTRE